jgi:hypothetical protein
VQAASEQLAQVSPASMTPLPQKVQAPEMQARPPVQAASEQLAQVSPGSTTLLPQSAEQLLSFREVQGEPGQQPSLFWQVVVGGPIEQTAVQLLTIPV